ncbi:MAG: hypothetical protein ACOX46_00685 [Limnochordia bacterium]
MKAVLFDLDGTLLPMDMEIFLREYLQKLGVKAAAYGYDPAKMVEVVMAGVEAMIQNDGSMTNEERFWQLFLSRIGGEKEAHYKLFEEFYTNEFAPWQGSFSPLLWRGRPCASWVTRDTLRCWPPTPFFPVWPSWKG